MAEDREAGKTSRALPDITPERVREEIKRVRLGIAQDLKEYEVRYPKGTEKTLSRVMTE